MDDERIVQDTLGRMLRSIGYEVSFADEGGTAVEMYGRAKDAGEPFDLVIMDLTIRGGMGGKETIEHLQAIDPEVKAIVSSGYSTDPLMADYTGYGFAGVVAKPFTMKELRRALEEARRIQR